MNKSPTFSYLTNITFEIEIELYRTHHNTKIPTKILTNKPNPSNHRNGVKKSEIIHIDKDINKQTQVSFKPFLFYF